MKKEALHYEFDVGQAAVHRCHGVGTIEGIETSNVGGLQQDFYVLKIHSTNALVKVPTSSARTAGLRKVVSLPEEVEGVYKILGSPSKHSRATWNRRFRALTEKLNTGCLTQIAEVIRDLYWLDKVKRLSFGEKKLLEQARNRFVGEISAARGIEKKVVENEISNILNSFSV